MKGDFFWGRLGKNSFLIKGYPIPDIYPIWARERLSDRELNESMLMALKIAVTDLIEYLAQKPNFIESPCTMSVTLPSSFDALAWLSHQRIFPQFYWQNRDDGLQSIAIGQTRVFANAEEAERALTPQSRVFGGQGFDVDAPLSGFFFLPLLELRQTQSKCVWEMQVDGRNAQAACHLLRTLTFDTPTIPSIDAHITHQVHTPEFPQWADLIDKALTSIDQTALKKVVLARRTRLSLSNAVTPEQLLAASREKNGDCFHFMMALDHDHCFLGSSPERLFLRQDRALKTEALAGTVGRSRVLEQDEAWTNWLLNDPKNRHENQLVVDDILSRLSDDCDDLTVSPQPEILRLRQVQHLRRPIIGELKYQVSNAHLLQRLQPTAAISGLPRDLAKSFLKQHEPFPRGWYSGAIGQMSLAHSEFCVAIRSALWAEGHWHLFAGAGIVPGSEAESEWQEINRKTATLCSLFVNDPVKVKVNNEAC